MLTRSRVRVWLSGAWAFASGPWVRHPGRPVPRPLDDLASRILDRGFTPAQQDVEGLFVLLGSPDREQGRLAGRALARLGPPALAAARVRFPAAGPPLRARLCELIATVGADTGDEEVGAWLLACLADPEGATRRRAAAQLGKHAEVWASTKHAVEPALLGAWEATRDPADRRALAEALGKQGGAASQRSLAHLHDPRSAADALLGQRTARAQRQIEQRTLRHTPTRLRLEAALPAHTPVLLHVRAGLEPVLLEELAALPLRAPPRQVGPGRVRVHAERLADLYRARTFLHLGFPLPPMQGDPVAAVGEALTADATGVLLRTLTEGPVRYRLDWGRTALGRTATQAVARQVQQQIPWLVNDATQAPWEVVVHLAGERVHVELWPRRSEGRSVDDRFAYRRVTMPASSHPTVAAALVRVAGHRDHDVVWDPFAGTGVELVERGLAGAYRCLYGSDLDPEAVDACRRNLAAAGLAEAEVVQADARRYTPPRPPTLIITNPPFGQRVVVHEGVGDLLAAVFSHAARCLAPRGRMVFVTPRVSVTARALSEAGLVRLRHLPVDLGGFAAHLELWEKR